MSETASATSPSLTDLSIPSIELQTRHHTHTHTHTRTLMASLTIIYSQQSLTLQQRSLRDALMGRDKDRSKLRRIIDVERQSPTES